MTWAWLNWVWWEGIGTATLFWVKHAIVFHTVRTINLIWDCFDPVVRVNFEGRFSEMSPLLRVLIAGLVRSGALVEATCLSLWKPPEPRLGFGAELICVCMGRYHFARCWPENVGLRVCITLWSLSVESDHPLDLLLLSSGFDCHLKVSGDSCTNGKAACRISFCVPGEVGGSFTRWASWNTTGNWWKWIYNMK